MKKLQTQITYETGSFNCGAGGGITDKKIITFSTPFTTIPIVKAIIASANNGYGENPNFDVSVSEITQSGFIATVWDVSGVQSYYPIVVDWSAEATAI